MAVKFYTETTTINGKEYKAQFSGISVAAKAADSTYIDGTNNTSMEKWAKYIFDNIIVEPKGLTLDDFDTYEDMQEVVGWGAKVMSGSFRTEKVENGTRAKSKE